MGEDEAGSARTRSDPLPVRTGPARHRRSLASGPAGFAAFCLAEYSRNWRTRTCALAMLAVIAGALAVAGATWAARQVSPGQAMPAASSAPAEGHVKGHPGRDGSAPPRRVSPAQVSPVQVSPLPAQASSPPPVRASSPPARATASQPPPPSTAPPSTAPAATATPTTPAATPTAAPTATPTVTVPTPSLEPPPTATLETSAPPTAELPASSEAAPSGP